jgi:acyl-CoA synthetase (NDP forming)
VTDAAMFTGTQTDGERAIRAILAPRSVVVIGASSDPRKLIAAAPAQNLMACGYTGRVHLVNPRGTTHEKFANYASIADLPEVPDCALIVTPASAVPSALRDCATLGIPAAVVSSAGLGDNDLAACRALPIRFLGPESLGVTNLLDGFVGRAALNGRDPATMLAGRIALLTQSGATSNILFHRAQARSVGVAYSLNTGRQADLDIWDVARVTVADNRVSVVAMAVESLPGRAVLADLAQRSRLEGTPVLVLVMGRSEVGSRAASSHSGALVGTRGAYGAALRRFGLVEVSDLDELWTTAALCDAFPAAGRGAGARGLGLVAMSGGEGILVADAADEIGVAMPPVDEGFVSWAAEHVPEATAQNPLDPTTRVLERPERFRDLVKRFVAAGGFSDVLVSLPVYSPSFARTRLPAVLDALAAVRGVLPSGTGLMVSAWDAGELTTAAEDMLAAADVPYLGTSYQTVRALRRYWQVLDARPGDAPVAPPPRPGPGPLTYSAATNLARGLGVPLPRCVVVDVEDTAALADAVAEVGTPCVVKADVNSAEHKAARGLVAVGLTSVDDVTAAAQAMTDNQLCPRRIVVEEQITGPSDELLVGALVDDTLGPILLLGAGGADVEQRRDVAIELAPAGDADLRSALLRTARGRAVADRHPVAVDRIVAIAAAVGGWIAAHAGDVRAIEFNPILVRPDGTITAVDARVEPTTGTLTSGVTR